MGRAVRATRALLAGSMRCSCGGVAGLLDVHGIPGHAKVVHASLGWRGWMGRTGGSRAWCRCATLFWRDNASVAHRDARGCQSRCRSRRVG